MCASTRACSIGKESRLATGLCFLASRLLLGLETRDFIKGDNSEEKVRAEDSVECILVRPSDARVQVIGKKRYEILLMHFLIRPILRCKQSMAE